MPFEIFTADHNTTLSQVASLSRMNLRSPYTDAILADSDVPTLALGLGLGLRLGLRLGLGLGLGLRLELGLGPNLIDRKLGGPEPDTSAVGWARTRHKCP